MYIEPTGKLLLCTDISWGNCPLCTYYPWGHYYHVILSYKGYISVDPVIYPVWLPYFSCHYLQTWDYCYSYLSCSSITSWISWFMIYPYTLLSLIHGGFDWLSCGFSVWYIAVIGDDSLYTCICLRHFCGISRSFTCNFFLIVNWSFHQLRSELYKWSALQRLG